MSRMHSSSKGKSRSKKPLATKPVSWMSYKAEEIKAIITKLAKQGLQSSQIGLQLRDQYGIPNIKIAAKKGVTEILRDEKLAPEIPEDLSNLIGRAKQTAKHLEANKKDMSSKRGLQLIESKIRRLAKYYKSKGQLPAKWAYLKDNE